MDKKKKKAKKKAKLAANSGEPSVSDHSQRQHRSSKGIPSVVAGENKVPSACVSGAITSATDLRNVDNAQYSLAATPLDMKESQVLETVDRHLVDGRPDGASNLDTTDFCGGEKSNGESFDLCTNEEQVERAKMQALIIQMTQMQALAQEKEQVVRELQELQEALAIERDTAELLRDQMTYLQGHVAEREALELGTRKEVQHLNAENVYLQGLVADLTEKVRKLEEELECAEEERGKLEDENRRVISRKEREEEERAAALIRKVGKLEQEREDLEEKQSKLKQEGRQLIVKMEQEEEKMEQLSRQMVARVETERQSLEQEIRQMAVKMEQEQEKLEMERSQMKEKLEQERLRFHQENKQKSARLNAEGEKLEKENRLLLLTIEQEREAFHQERNQMRAIIGLERETLEQERLQMAEKVAVERKHIEFEYKQKKAKLERNQEMLDHDRRQITATMTALDMQLEQLELEASVRDRVFKDLATATQVDSSSKKWESWRVYGKHPLAEAIAVAEEARMQRTAMAQTVDKLLAENVELMGKVNEQAITINDLTKGMSSYVIGINEITYDGVDDAQEVIWRPEMEAEARELTETNTGIYQSKPDGFEDYGEHMNGYTVQGMNGNTSDRDIKGNADLSTGRRKEEPTAAKSSNVYLNQESSAAITGRTLSEESGSYESFTTLYEITEIRDDPSDPAKLVNSHEESPIAPVTAPGKASSLMKAPVRFLSFVAGYISGADLVKE